ncbi:MAG TPA: 2'-5' RNA ligase family protein [Amycolatopsis sp.]|uniref:2'-5' RNA ligase family protein n=1 Tax=Amycolatopsis sp. TaxID=37632 RepID=UPI002B4A6B91|nr:2'-5' RNA ligase family protein [Amycolatopsis sp.]HKS49295.1 2'-5' RNA ligase family protein [Amycolatopsis sp.]
MLLFSALLPPPEVVESIRAELADLGSPEGVRWSAPDLWHVTLGYYGEETDPDARAEWLRDKLTGQVAPTLRLAGAGSFSHVLYLGVYGDGLTELATAAGAGQDRPYLPHLTLARTRRAVPPELPRLLAGYSSPEWTATEAVLMRSDPVAGPSGGATPGPASPGVRYSVVERYGLRSAQVG